MRFSCVDDDDEGVRTSRLVAQQSIHSKLQRYSRLAVCDAQKPDVSVVATMKVARACASER